MTGRLPTLTARQVMRALERAGFVLARSRGSHHKFVFPGRPERFAIVPNHPGDLKRPVVRSIIKQAGMTESEFAAFL
ncbi:MAG TPA: type II toxin-antitoxin system HicA family toxin [Alphaproteobacteria bacterium]